MVKGGNSKPKGCGLEPYHVLEGIKYFGKLSILILISICIFILCDLRLVKLISTKNNFFESQNMFKRQTPHV